ncbi:hypothetical protein MASR1M31_12700 [Porphyromonadaceae bacterium]
MGSHKIDLLNKNTNLSSQKTNIPFVKYEYTFNTKGINVLHKRYIRFIDSSGLVSPGKRSFVQFRDTHMAETKTGRKRSIITLSTCLSVISFYFVST